MNWRACARRRRGASGGGTADTFSLTDVSSNDYNPAEGVRVNLLVRGICCLRPGVPGLSENIQVTSIVGRFLEHSRIYYFRNGGAEEIYLGSADLMPRNLNRRVEVLFPVAAPRMVARVRDEILTGCLADDATARHMRGDGTYTPKPARGRFDSQSWFLAQRGVRPASPDQPTDESNGIPPFNITENGVSPDRTKNGNSSTNRRLDVISLKAEIASLREELGAIRTANRLNLKP